MLQVRKIDKKFGAREVLNNVSFRIKEGSVVGLLGPNGAGKTTLMRILVGYLWPNGGQILWNKKIVDSRSRRHKKRLGYLPENNPLYGYMTVAEYLDYMANIKEVGDREDIDKALKSCGLLEVSDQKIETLSKGYRQRVGMAAAILGQPELLIFDEPTSGLDPNQIIEIRELIKRLAKNRIVILSTHILPEAKAICDHLLLINRGEIVLDRATASIKNLEKKFVELTV